MWWIVHLLCSMFSLVEKFGLCLQYFEILPTKQKKLSRPTSIEILNCYPIQVFDCFWQSLYKYLIQEKISSLASQKKNLN